MVRTVCDVCEKQFEKDAGDAVEATYMGVRVSILASQISAVRGGKSKAQLDKCPACVAGMLQALADRAAPKKEEKKAPAKKPAKAAATKPIAGKKKPN